MRCDFHAHPILADEQVVYIRVPAAELHVEDRTADFYNNTAFLIAHCVSPPPANSAEPVISVISCVMAAWRAILY